VLVDGAVDDVAAVDETGVVVADVVAPMLLDVGRVDGGHVDVGASGSGPVETVSSPPPAMNTIATTSTATTPAIAHQRAGTARRRSVGGTASR
jgi:hypothetical protein